MPRPATSWPATGGGGRECVRWTIRKTFTERLEDEEAVNAIRKEVEKAEIIVFLGFAFHSQNMELIRLEPREKQNMKRVFATALGISGSDAYVVYNQVVETLNLRTETKSVQIRNDLTCAGLFDEYWRSLSLVWNMPSAIYYRAGTARTASAEAPSAWSMPLSVLETYFYETYRYVCRKPPLLGISLAFNDHK
jgi:hypothetical protein